LQGILGTGFVLLHILSCIPWIRSSHGDNRMWSESREVQTVQNFCSTKMLQGFLINNSAVTLNPLYTVCSKIMNNFLTLEIHQWSKRTVYLCTFLMLL
jgi:hypothetical protein